MTRTARARKRSKARARSKKKDPIYVDGQRPRPMFVDYKDVDLLKKLINRHGRIVGRRKTGRFDLRSTVTRTLGHRWRKYIE